MRNGSKITAIIMFVATIAFVFTACSHVGDKSSSKSVENKARRRLSATRSIQGIISKSNVSMLNNQLKKQVDKYKFTDGTAREKIIANGVSCEWLIPAEIVSEDVLLYIHGGGFVMGITPGHLQMTANLAGKMKIRALMIDYRLAPQYPFPAALEDCITVYNWLLTQISPNNIVIAGDSAGGNLAITTLLKLRELNIPFPVAVASLSPAVNLVPKANYKEGYKDPLLHPKAAEFFNVSYLGNEDPKNPLLSPFFADLSGLPPILMHIGEDEMLLDNAVLLFNSAKETGADVIYKVYSGMWHVWQLYPELSQTEQSLNEIADFLLSYLKKGF